MDEQLQLQEGSINELDEGVRKRCKALNARDDPCAGWVMGGSDWCWVHNPANQEAVDAGRKLGGHTSQAKHSPRVNVGDIPKKIRTVEDVLNLLDYCKDEMLMLTNGLSRNKGLMQLGSTYLQTLQEGELQDHVGDLEDRMIEITDLLKKAKDPRKYR